MREHERGQRVAEDYVAAIAMLGAEGQLVIGARLAKLFGVSAPTVTETLRRLENAGYVQIAPSKGVSLTPAGQELAQRTLRRRRVAERFCVDVLGFSLADAQAEADRLEHALSDVAADRLARALGQPEACPHGDPIDEPARPVGFVATTLDRAPQGIDLVVERVDAEACVDERVFHDLAMSGLVPGCRVTVLSSETSGLVVQCSTGQVTLARSTAQALQVRQARPGRDPRAGSGSGPRYRVQVASVQGTCLAGHRSGDRFEFSHCAPSGLCLEALQKLYPALAALRLAGSAASAVQVPCPEDGIVTFTLERDASAMNDEGTRS